MYVFLFSFNSRNFLQLDVFFGELKYEFIEQLKGYDTATLFSEYA